MHLADKIGSPGEAVILGAGEGTGKDSASKKILLPVVGKSIILTTVELGEMERILGQLASQVECRLVELGIFGKTLTLKMRWSTFEPVTRAVSRQQGFQMSREMLPVLPSLLSVLVDGKKAVQLLRVTFPASSRQRRCNEQGSSWLLPSGKKSKCKDKLNDREEDF